MRDGSTSLDELDECDEDQEQKSSNITQMPVPKSQVSTMRRGSWSPMAEKSQRNNKGPKDVSCEPTPSPMTDRSTSSAPMTPFDPLSAAPSHGSLLSTALPILPGQKISTDIDFFINYHIANITHHHYLLKTDFGNFIKTKFIEYTYQSDALSHAVAAFSAFHYSITNKTWEFHTFLRFYMKAVGLLRVSLNKPHTIHTLLTILQLASFEVRS